MSKKNKHIDVKEENLDQWLGSTGFIFPRNESELDTFNKLYQGYDFKLKDVKIDPDQIINGSFSLETKILSITKDIDISGINELKVAARKGEGSIPDHILKKVKGKHKNLDESADK